MVSHINQQSSAVMVELLQALGAHFRAVAIDYPSHGNSDHIDWQPTIEDYARAVIETMDALGIERAAALGEAVGAAVSIALGSRWPQRIDKAVLINTPYFSDAETAKNDIADIAKVRPSDATGFPAPRTIEFLLKNDPEHAPMQPSQSWMDRINTAQFEIGRDRWQAMGALARFDTLGRHGGAQMPGADALWRAFHLRPASRAAAVEVPAGQGRDRAGRTFLHELGARPRPRGSCPLLYGLNTSSETSVDPWTTPCRLSTGCRGLLVIYTS